MSSPPKRLSFSASSFTDIKAADKDRRTPLHNAARASTEEIWAIPELIRSGADVKAADRDGRTPLHDVARAGTKEATWAIPELIRSGADVKAADKDGRTPLHDAARAGTEEATWAIRELIKSGADVKAADKDGRTPLHDAARIGTKETKLVIRELMRSGADVKAANKDGRTPLHDAVQAGSCNDAISELLSATTRDLICSKGEIFWEGLKAYRKCEGAISDILTISRLNSQGHCFIARSVSDFLQECCPSFGLEILRWITRICEQSEQLENSISFKDSSSATNLLVQTGPHHIDQDSTNSRPASHPSSTESRSSAPIQEIVIGRAAFVILRGCLEAGKLLWAMSTNSKSFAMEVEAAIGWTLSVLQSPLQEGWFSLMPVSLDIGLPKIAKFEPAEQESYCWTKLFSYACIVEIPFQHTPYRSTTAGLDIDFKLLLELAAVDREMTTEDGTLFFGFDTALIPLDPPESRRWHFLVTEGRQITLARVKKAFGSNRFQGEIKPEYRTGNVYVGWCAYPVVTVGSKGSDTLPIEEIMMSSGVPSVKKLEESVERSSSRDVSLFSRIGFLGSSVGVTWGGKKEKKFKEILVASKRTPKDNIEGILSSARAPCILWDHSTQRAWLISTVSVLLLASLRHVEWKQYSFKMEQANGQLEPAMIRYACRSDNTSTEAESTLRKNLMLQVDKAGGVTVNENISLEHIVKRIWFEMSSGEDVCFSDVTGCKLEQKGFLLGYDLNEAICETGKCLRALPISECIKSWQPLAHVKNTQVIFGRGIGAVVECDSSTGSDRCCTPKYPEGTLSCLFQDLRIFYGECWGMFDQPTQTGGLPIGPDHEWVPKGWESLCGQESRLCSRSLQSIARRKSQGQKLRKKSQNEGQKKNGRISFLFLKQSVTIMLTFGDGGVDSKKRHG